jgi:hypothetical protein
MSGGSYAPSHCYVAPTLRWTISQVVHRG